jgi:hypothetical protein
MFTLIGWIIEKIVETIVWQYVSDKFFKPVGGAYNWVKLQLGAAITKFTPTK